MTANHNSLVLVTSTYMPKEKVTGNDTDRMNYYTHLTVTFPEQPG